MSTTATSAQIPKLRFPGFEGAWEQVALGEGTKVIDCKHRTPQYVETGVPIISPGTIKWGPLDVVTPTKRVTEEEYVSLMDHCDPQLDDLVLSRNQSMGVASRIMTREKFVLGQDTVLIQQRNGNGGIIFFRLQTEGTQGVIGKLSGGSTFSRINLKDIRQIPLVLPTELDEQQKIAAFLTAVDGQIEQLSRKKALLEEYKKGVMQQLFTQTLRFQDDHGHDFPDWEEMKLSEIASIFDGTHSTPEYTKTGIPFYSVEHVTNGQYTKTKFISEEVFEKENKRVRLERGDILMTRIGDIGTSVHIDWDVKASFYVSLALIKLRKAMADSEYVHQAIGSRDFQRELWQRTIHSAFPIKINLGEIGECKLRLPSLPEQTKIAGILSAMDGKIAAVGEQMRQTQAWKKGLLQQLFV